MKRRRTFADTVKVEPFRWRSTDRTHWRGDTTLHIPCGTATIDYGLSVGLRFVRGNWNTSVRVSKPELQRFAPGHGVLWNRQQFDKLVEFWVPRLNRLNNIKSSSLVPAKRNVRSAVTEIMEAWGKEIAKPAKRVALKPEFGENDEVTRKVRKRLTGNLYVKYSRTREGAGNFVELILPQGLMRLSAHTEPGTIDPEDVETLDKYYIGRPSYVRHSTAMDSGTWKKSGVPYVVNYDKLIEVRRVKERNPDEKLIASLPEFQLVSDSSNLVEDAAEVANERPIVGPWALQAEHHGGIQPPDASSQPNIATLIRTLRDDSRIDAVQGVIR